MSVWFHLRAPSNAVLPICFHMPHEMWYCDLVTKYVVIYQSLLFDIRDLLYLYLHCRVHKVFLRTQNGHLPQRTWVVSIRLPFVNKMLCFVKVKVKQTNKENSKVRQKKIWCIFSSQNQICTHLIITHTHITHHTSHFTLTNQLNCFILYIHV